MARSNTQLPVRDAKTGRAHLVVLTLLALLLLELLATSAFGDVAGNCAHQQASRCTNEGVACVIDGQNGVCTTQDTGVAPYCFCSVNGRQLDETNATGSSGNPIPIAPATVTFTLVPNGPGVASLPFNFGGGAVEYSSFSGSVTIQSQPTADPNVDNIYVRSGTIVQDSLRLPNSRMTGPNTFTFVPQNSPSGTLNRTTGAFSFTANGSVTNSILASPILTQGRYFGTVNMSTGVATIDTTTFDTYQNVTIPALSTWGGVGLVVIMLALGGIALRARHRRRAQNA